MNKINIKVLDSFKVLELTNKVTKHSITKRLMHGNSVKHILFVDSVMGALMPFCGRPIRTK